MIYVTNGNNYVTIYGDLLCIFKRQYGRKDLLEEMRKLTVQIKISTMTKRLFVLFICFLSSGSFTIQAQSITPTKSTIQHKEGMRPCILVYLEPNTKSLKKEWVKFLKKEYDLKLKGAGFFSNRDLLSAEQVMVERWSTKQMDFYTHIVEDEKGSEMKVFISYGYDIYVSEEDYPSEFKSMNDMLIDFLKSYLPPYYSEKMKVATKDVSALNNEIISLKKDIEKNNREIEEHEQEVTQLKSEITKNKEKLQSAEIQLKETEAKMTSIKAELKKL